MTLKQLACTFALILLAPGLSSAALVTWTIDGTTNADGVSVSGTLGYDVEEDVFRNVSLVVRLDALVLRTFDADAVSSYSGGTRLILGNDQGDLSTQRFHLELAFDPGLAIAQEAATFSGTFATGMFVNIRNPPTHCVANHLGLLECDPWAGGWDGWVASRIDHVVGRATVEGDTEAPGEGTGVVPEPSTVLLLGIGLFPCATMRRRRRGMAPAGFRNRRPWRSGRSA